MGNKDGWLTASRFRFSCISQISTSNIMMINPEADNIRVRSEPAGFLLPRRFQKTMDGVWTVVDILPNPEFLRGVTPQTMQKVTLIIDLVDKFNRAFQFRYKTQVFSSENP